MIYRKKKNYWQQDIRKREYCLCLLRGWVVLAAVSYLFYDFLFGSLIFLPVLVIYLKIWEQQCMKKKKQEFTVQFKESLQAMSSALNVGYSAENAMRETLKDLSLIYRRETRIIQEYTYMVHQLDMNVPFEQVWGEFAAKVHQEDVNNFVAVFAAAKRSGGDSIQIIRGAVRQICEKIEVKNEIETTMASKKLEFQIMSIIPFGIIFYMRLAFREFMKSLYRNEIGITVMTVCLILYGTAYYMGRKLLEIEV